MESFQRQAVRDAFQRHGVRLALLFGSRARGRSRPDSDLDVAVDGNDVDTLGLGAELSSLLACDVDVVELWRAGYPLLRELVNEAVVIYERHPGAGASWRTRAILELEADQPWFERMRDAYLHRVAERGIVGW